MGESEWQHASWVSTLGKWAWIIIILIDIIGLIWDLFTLITLIAWLGFFGIAGAGASSWNIFGSIIGILIALFIIKPKFSKPCGEKDWDALYGWVLKLGGFNVPWMFIWGLILFLFGWYGAGALFVLVPAVMLLFAGPKEYKWSEEKAPK
jgi:hypothetical protein